MDKRGGKRVSAGRPATGRTTTKATIYIRDRELINNYAKSIKLICATCRSGDFLAKDEESGKITCTKCNRVYHGGYDELVELNQQVIDDEIENMKDEVRQDIVKDINAMFKKAGFKLK